MRGMKTAISMWVKIPYTLFVCVLVPVYWVKNGPANFLWGSDIALLVVLFALWFENSLAASMMAVGTLLVEIVWNIDYVVRLIFGVDAISIGGTRYMFDADTEIWLRGLSLFHVFLPIVVLYVLHRLGYDRRALKWEIALAWLVLPLSYLIGSPEENINFVWGFGQEPQSLMPGPMYVASLMILFPVLVFYPTHLVLSRLFTDASRLRAASET
jgi:hypothetical protein